MKKITIGDVYRQVKNGKTVYVRDIRVTTADGIRKVISTSGSCKRDVVERARKKYETLICKHGRASEAEVTFGSYAHNWVHEVYKPQVQSNTWGRVEQVLRLQVIPFLGDMYMNEIRRADVKRMLQHFADVGHSYTTLKKYRSAVSLVFSHYQDEHDNLNFCNPAEKVRIPDTAAPPVSKTRVCFTAEQLDAIAAAATATDSTGKLIYRLGYSLIVMMFTGIRTSELLGLCWEDVAEDFSYFDIKNAAIRDGNRTVLKLGTKSKCSRRIVNLCEPARAALKKLHDVTGGDILVMSTKEHTLFSYVDFNRMFHNILKRADIKLKPGTRVGAHSFRHTFATNMAKYGVSPEVTASILGHSSVVCTLDHYVHPDNERKIKAMEDLASSIDLNLPREDEDFNETEHMYLDDSVE